MKNHHSLTFIFFMSVASAAMLSSCTPAESSKAVPVVNAPIPVKILPLQQEQSNHTIITSGQFSTDDETTLSFKTGGIVDRILVKEGDFVKKGQLLATLDLTEIRAQVNQAELGHEKAQRDFTRAGNLFRDSVATLEQFQNAQTALSIAQQQLDAAKFNLSFSEIRSVSAGYILNKYVSAGQYVSPGNPIIRTNGAGKSQWIFKAGLSDKEWAAVQIGDKATLVVDHAPGKPLQAEIIRKSEGADPKTGAFYIEIKAENEDKVQLASGMFGTATIASSGISNVWNIPYEALLDGNANKGFVFITNDHKTAQKIPVIIAGIDGDFIRIHSGLSDSSSLIIQGSAYLTHNSEISIVD